MKEKRFKRIFRQGSLEGTDIWVDTKTGVNYMFHYAGYAGGITPLLDENGKVVVTKDLDNLDD